MMCGFLLKGQNERMAASQSAETIASSESAPQEPPNGFVTDEVFAGYLSDIEDDTIEDWEEVPADKEEEEEQSSGGDSDSESDPGECEASKLDDIPESMFHVQPPPSRKRHRHAIPVRLARKRQKLQVQKELELALVMIEKYIASKKELFAAGRNGL
jgi:hypothetical protein